MMEDFKPEVRPAERSAYCRACEKTISIGEQMVSWYSYRNRGMNIHIHLHCAVEIGQRADQALKEQQ